MIQPVTAGLLQHDRQVEQQTAIAASQYTLEELTAIYNRTRVDYIVPMPMNARRMAEYVRHYDIDLNASAVTFYEGDVTGIAMMGRRDQRAWITRLGVIPECRGRKTGSFLMDALLNQARARGASLVQLEVIQGNDPAYYLFRKFGFTETRELRVIRRPPGMPQTSCALDNATITPLDSAELMRQLQHRPAGASWVEETASLIHAGNLYGFRLELPTGEHGWIICHHKAFQMAHFVYDATPSAYDSIISALLHHLHTTYAGLDTIIENLPADHPAWPLFQQLGYVESFRRIEMTLDLT